MLNKSVNNMYLFINGTWNPIKGLCPFLCVYCYMLGIYKRFKSLMVSPLIIAIPSSVSIVTCLQSSRDLSRIPQCDWNRRNCRLRSVLESSFSSEVQQICGVTRLKVHGLFRFLSNYCKKIPGASQHGESVSGILILLNTL